LEAVVAAGCGSAALAAVSPPDDTVRRTAITDATIRNLGMVRLDSSAPGMPAPARHYVRLIPVLIVHPRRESRY